MNGSRPIGGAEFRKESHNHEVTHTSHHHRGCTGHGSATGRREVNGALMTRELDDDTVLSDLRSECARWAQRDELEGGFARLFELRDEALRRGLPLPMSCPLDTPAS